MAEIPRPDRSFDHILAGSFHHENEDPFIQTARMEVTLRVGAERNAAAWKNRAENAEASALQWREIATTDSLTGLANRLQITSKLEQLVATKPNGFALWFIDVDGLKAVNDNEGHEAGNQLIRSVADALKPGNTFYGRMPARLSGDEFVVIEEIDPDSELLPQEQLTVKNHQLKESLEMAGIEASTGATLHTAGQSATDLIELADQAMYLDKQERKAALRAEKRAEKLANMSPDDMEKAREARRLLGEISMSGAELDDILAAEEA